MRPLEAQSTAFKSLPPARGLDRFAAVASAAMNLFVSVQWHYSVRNGCKGNAAWHNN